jgi:hypothetical protein
VLDEADAAAFLLQRTESKRHKTPADPQDAAAIACDLGGLALALEQAGAYVAKSGLSFSEYRLRWESRQPEVLAWHDVRLMNYRSSVAVTWQTTVDQLSPAERFLLDILSWLGPEPIPVSLFADVLVDDVDARDAIVGLESWSLTRWTADKAGFTIHRLVQEITRQQLADGGKESSLNAVLDIFDRILPDPEWNEEGWRQWERLAPHVRAVLHYLEGRPIETTATEIMNRYGTWLARRAQYSDAERLLLRALSIEEHVLGPDHPNVTPTLNNLCSSPEKTDTFFRGNYRTGGPY